MLEELQRKMTALLDETQAIQQRHADGKPEAGDAKRAGELAGELKKTGADIDAIKGERDNMAQLANLAGMYAGATAAKTDGAVTTGDTGRAIQPHSIRAFMETDGYKRVAQTGLGQSGHFELGPEMSFYARSNPAGFARDFPEEAKTLVYTGATASLLLPDRIAGIYRPDPVVKRARDAFLQGRTTGQAISYVSESTVTNNAASIVEATGISAGAPTPAGSAFPESAITFTVASETVKSIGHMIPVTKEMLMDVALMETYLRDRMFEMLDDKIDAQLLNGTGGNDLTGLNNVSGATVLDAAYFTANPVESAGQPAENADRIRRARTYLRLVPRAQATDVIINPYDLEALQTARDANGNYVFGGVIGQNGALADRIGGLNIIESENQTLGIADVVARTAFGVFDRMENTLEVTDANRNWFEHRILAMAVWARLALVAFRPAAVAKVSLL